VSDLEGRGFTLKKHNLAKERPPRELLSKLIDEHGLETVMNTRSPAFKARGLDTGKLTRAAALDLMEEEPNLIKRPLAIGKKKVVFGYKPDEYETLG
jgi:Spx/MgsR family transcriptional regulator